jgi:glucose/arabinose dehydrogenase
MKTPIDNWGFIAFLFFVGVAGFVPYARGQDRLDPAPGTEFYIDPQSLPEPYAEPTFARSAQRVPRPAVGEPGQPHAAILRLPPGFTASLFAEGQPHPRQPLAISPTEILLVQSRPGIVTRLIDRDQDGKAELSETLLQGLERPFGIAYRQGTLYVADTRAVWRYSYEPGLAATAMGAGQALTAPGALGDDSGHWTRSLALSPAGDILYIGIGSAANIAEEPLPRASVQALALQTGLLSTFASGVRNPVGIAVRAGDEAPTVVVNERDGLGDHLVPDYLTRLVAGGFYGWPYSYLGGRPQPGFAEKAPEKLPQTIMPDLLFAAHSAPIGLAFADQNPGLPAPYRDGAFIGLRGSWNRGEPTGYFVAYAPYEQGKATGRYQVFASGFRLETPGASREEAAQVWGRPAGLSLGPDGALYVADDTGGTVWRIVWQAGGQE